MLCYAFSKTYRRYAQSSRAARERNQFATLPSEETAEAPMPPEELLLPRPAPRPPPPPTAKAGVRYSSTSRKAAQPHCACLAMLIPQGKPSRCDVRKSTRQLSFASSQSLRWLFLLLLLLLLLVARLRKFDRRTA
jgi:hypothetical protein